MRLRRCAHGNLLRSTHERARMRCMGGLTGAHLRLAALSCSRCEQLPKTLLADAARERRAPAFLARVARFGRVNRSIHTRGRPLSKSTRNMFLNLYAMPTDVWATKKNAPVRFFSEVNSLLPKYKVYFQATNRFGTSRYRYRIAWASSSTARSTVTTRRMAPSSSRRVSLSRV